MEILINFLDTYQLITQKQADYLLFKQAYEIIKNKEHLTHEGINKLVSIKSSLNNGLSENLKSAFPGVISFPRPLVTDQSIKDPQWLAGFSSAEGCFLVSLYKSESNTLKESVKLIFYITQHTRDTELMKSLIKYLDCGRYVESFNQL